MTPTRNWLTSSRIPFDELDGKKVFCDRMGPGDPCFGTALMHVERHMDDARKAVVRVESESPGMPGWTMFLEQADIGLLRRDETSITGAFVCRKTGTRLVSHAPAAER